MSRSVLFNGAVLIRAGGATKVDASAFQNLGLGGVGNVGLIGEADGGEPNVVQLFRTPQSMVEAYRAGALADAADLAFRPMNDLRVPGGASVVMACKVNQATRSSKTLKNGADDVVTIQSIDYGAHTLKISVEVATSGGGKIIEFVFEDGVDKKTETSSVLGATAEFTVKYNGAGSACTMTITSTQITTSVTGGPGGENLTIPFTTYSTLNEIINFINNSAGGVYTAVAVTKNPFTFLGADLDRVTAVDIKTLTTSFYAKLYRIIEWVNSNSALVTATRTPATTTAATSGASPGTSTTTTFNLTPADTLLVKVNGVGAQTATFDATAATVPGGGGTFSAMAAETFAVQFESGDVQTVTFGTEASLALAVALINTQIRGGRAVENAGQVDLVSDVRGTGSKVTTSAVAAGVTSKLGIPNSTVANGTGDVANIDAVTLAEAKALIEADITTPGLTFTWDSYNHPILTSLTTGLTSTIEVTGGSARTIFGFDLLEHAGSVAGSPGGSLAPDDSAAAFLTGGTRGTSTNTNWQDGLDLLGRVRVNELAPLISQDLANEGYGSTATFASVAAMVDSHVAYYSSTKGKSERQAYIGMKGTKTQILAQAGTLQSPHTVLTAQRVTRSDHTGTLKEFDEWGLAVIAAGGRAGSNMGEPLVYKNIRSSGLAQDSSWNPEDDGDDMVLGGVTFAFAPPNQGYKFDRVITTFTKLDNDAYVEESIVMGWKNVAYELRTQLENIFTGVRGLPSTIENIKIAASRILEAFRQEGQIVDSILTDGSTLRAYRELYVTLDGDIARLSVIVSPVSGINFQLSTLFLVPATIAA
jgi:hypothetical protein